MAESAVAQPTLRRARGADAAALTELAIRSKAIWGYDAAFLAACRMELTLTSDDVERHPTYVIASANGPIGHYLLRLREGRAEIHHLFVAPEAVRSGLGSRLWRHLEQTARDGGVVRLEVDSDPNAEGFYRAMGMTRAAEAPSGSIPGRFLPHLTKPL